MAVFLMCDVALALNRHSMMALMLLIAAWIFCLWRISVWVRERREHEAQQWTKIDLAHLQYSAQRKGR
jgi:hypothetical protein